MLEPAQQHHQRPQHVAEASQRCHLRTHGQGNICTCVRPTGRPRLAFERLHFNRCRRLPHERVTSQRCKFQHHERRVTPADDSKPKPAGPTAMPLPAVACAFAESSVRGRCVALSAPAAVARDARCTGMTESWSSRLAQLEGTRRRNHHANGPDSSDAPAGAPLSPTEAPSLAAAPAAGRPPSSSGTA
jgi:hypothetical protein